MTFWICSSVAECSITMTMGPSISFPSVASRTGLAVRTVRAFRLLRGQPLQPPRLVDDALEHPLDRRRIQGSGIVAHHPLQDPRLPLRRVHRQPQAPLDAADL